MRQGLSWQPLAADCRHRSWENECPGSELEYPPREVASITTAKKVLYLGRWKLYNHLVPAKRNRLSNPWSSTWPSRASVSLAVQVAVSHRVWCSKGKQILVLFYWCHPNLTYPQLWTNSRGHIGIWFSESLVSIPLSTLHLRKVPTKKSTRDKSVFLAFV